MHAHGCKSFLGDKSTAGSIANQQHCVMKQGDTTGCKRDFMKQFENITLVTGVVGLINNQVFKIKTKPFGQFI